MPMSSHLTYEELFLSSAWIAVMDGKLKEKEQALLDEEARRFNLGDATGERIINQALDEWQG